MYKFLLAWRYLRTRFIALASIVSVTLGVATLIVVNSVMAGFIAEMENRLHGILSDIELSSTGLGELDEVEWRSMEIRRVLGDDIEQLTQVVRVPALLHFEFRGRPFTQQILLIGIDDKTYGQVTDFQPYLMNEHHRQGVDFQLQEDGYDPTMGQAGWPYRRQRVQQEREMQAAYAAYRRQQAPPPQPVAEPLAPLTNSSGDELSASQSHTGQQSSGPLPVLPAEPPQLPPMDAAASTAAPSPIAGAVTPFDPYADLRPTLSPEEMFDPAREQHTGLVLGVSLASRRIVDADTKETTDLYLFKPGDDVHITLPTAGANLSPITEHCTVVDLYRSNMHEYDSMFAFMPLSRLQHLRGMIDPLTGLASASALQIKLRPGADLNQARDKLAARFPPDQHPVVVQTWQDTQRPLLSAVELEVTILNILLFLIIAVAGFGILATFFMIVVEKTRDIGILKSLGAPSRGVGCIFLSYGLSLGAVGTGVGVLGGLLIVHYINGIAALVQRVTGREIFDPTIYYFSEIPTIVRAETILWIGVGAIAIAVLASVLPALRAARLHPVEALRYE